MFFRHSLFFLYVAFLPRFFGKFKAAFSVDAYILKFEIHLCKECANLRLRYSADLQILQVNKWKWIK